MNVRPIKTEADYDWALAEVAAYFDDLPEPGTPEADRFDVLADLIEAYENRVYPLPDLDPVDALTLFMAETGRSQADLAALLGTRSRASEILNRKRTLTVAMIHRIRRDWNLPPELLIKPYQRAA